MTKKIILKNKRIQVEFDPSRGCRLMALKDLGNGRTLTRQDGQLLVSGRESIELTAPGKIKVLSVKQGPIRDNHLGSGTGASVRLQFVLDGAKVELARRIDLPDDAGAVRILDTWSTSQPISGLWYSELIRLTFPDAAVTQVHDWFTCSDQTNHRLITRSGKGRTRGILFTTSSKKNPDTDGIFVWKEGPAPDSRPVKGSYDFDLKKNTLSVVGTGFANAGPGEERRSDAVVIGLLEDRETLLGLRRWQHARYRRKNLAERVEWIANSWPAFHLDVNEEKILGEIDAAARSGFQVVTIDDGWFKTFMGEVDNDKFPGGFTGVAKRAKEKKVRVGLWMNPLGMDNRDPRARIWDGAECHDTVSEGNDWNWVARTSDFQPCETYLSEGVRGYLSMDLCNPGYFTYLRDRILSLAKDFDIRHYKFDLYQLSAYDALTGDAHQHYEAYRRFLDALKAAEITVEMDVTRSNRPCFDFGLDYGRLFLENRGRSLRDHRWYQPWISLANLWDAARMAPSQLVELEIFPQLDEYPLDYLLATAFTTNPLFFGSLAEMNPTRLERIRTFIQGHEVLRKKVLAGFILPVGKRPAENAWSGFVSLAVDQSEAYLVVYKNGPKTKTTETFELKNLFSLEGSVEQPVKAAGDGEVSVMREKISVSIREDFGWQVVRLPGKNTHSQKKPQKKVKKK